MAFNKDCDEATVDAIRNLVGGNVEVRQAAGFESKSVIMSLDVWDVIRNSKTYPHTFREDARTGLRHAFFTYVRGDGTTGEIKVVLISQTSDGPNFIEVV